MYTDELYKRSLGQQYDSGHVSAAVADGVSGYDSPIDRSNGFEGQNGLMIELGADDAANVSDNDERLITIDLEIQKLEWKRTLSVEDAERHIILDAEKAVRLEQRAIESMQDDPESAGLLKAVFFLELEERVELGQPVDELMFEEARDLAIEIARQNDDLDEQQLLIVFDAMKDAIMAQHNLESELDLDHSVGSYSLLQPPMIAA